MPSNLPGSIDSNASVKTTSEFKSKANGSEKADGKTCIGTLIFFKAIIFCAAFTYCIFIVDYFFKETIIRIEHKGSYGSPIHINTK